MNYLRFRLQNSPFIKYGKDAAGRPPSQPLTHVLQTHSRPEEPERTAKTKTRHPTTQSFHQPQITMIHIIHL
ncbi:Hypothetical protein FKW44_008190 [Caligus rogercresseyi]|uniref:Uncharacterized protein n=1 Tax=Caligus rogercresseyi TaxID=217165 RepID=A0A7T8QU36_CALRO|nr:Hypothetical protein FKW44_008190 [Caligus rogercresseyi]